MSPVGRFVLQDRDSQSRPRHCLASSVSQTSTEQGREVFVKKTIYTSLCSEESSSLEKYLSVIRNVNFQGASVLGQPSRVERLGETQLPYSVFLDYVLSLGENKFR